ncbi:MAG: hypothetical protein A2506_09625 [Elusimicrobia bacterium RIFOXYD12_FULL_66_9]|nr:MAG: hypothetical protein A2506_09625 [Elusimicrobia bacterium RIFOXYD12_FULL_66_9]
MTDAQPHDYEKPAREAVASALKELSSGWPEKAALITCQQISHAAQVAKDPHAAVVAVCRGALSGVLLSNQNLPDAVLKLLEKLPDTSLIMRSGPEELMSWVLEGAADVTLVAGPSARDAISAKIEEKFMGVGPVFDALCEKARLKG